MPKKELTNTANNAELMRMHRAPETLLLQAAKNDIGVPKRPPHVRDPPYDFQRNERMRDTPKPNLRCAGGSAFFAWQQPSMIRAANSADPNIEKKPPGSLPPRPATRDRALPSRHRAALGQRPGLRGLAQAAGGVHQRHQVGPISELDGTEPCPA